MDVYVDESGDLGFSLGSSRFFVVSYLMAGDSEPIRRVMKRFLGRSRTRKRWGRRSRSMSVATPPFSASLGAGFRGRLISGVEEDVRACPTRSCTASAAIIASDRTYPRVLCWWEVFLGLLFLGFCFFGGYCLRYSANMGWKRRYFPRPCLVSSSFFSSLENSSEEYPSSLRSMGATYSLPVSAILIISSLSRSEAFWYFYSKMV